MAHYHTHDTHDHGSTLVTSEDDSSPSVFLAVIAIVLIGFLIWLFAFSGLVFDRDTTTTVPPRDETNVETNVDQAPPPNTAPQQQPAPGSS